MPAIRHFTPTLLHEVSQRVNGGVCCFDPNNAELRDAFLGALAKSQRRYGVKVLAFHFTNNHYNGLFQIPSAGKFSRFLAHFHAGLAAAYHRVCRTDGKLWGYMTWNPVATDERSVCKRLKYIMGQAVAEGLVSHPGRFPGASSVDWMLNGAPLVGTVFDGTRRCRDRRRKAGPDVMDGYVERLNVQMTPPDCWASLPDDALRVRYRRLADELAGLPATDRRRCHHVDNKSKITIASPTSAYRLSPVTPKLPDAPTVHVRRPRILAVDPAEVAAYETAYAKIVATYRFENDYWLQKIRRRAGSVRFGALNLPADTLVGTMPFNPRARPHRARQHPQRPGGPKVSESAQRAARRLVHASADSVIPSRAFTAAESRGGRDRRSPAAAVPSFTNVDCSAPENLRRLKASAVRDVVPGASPSFVVPERPPMSMNPGLSKDGSVHVTDEIYNTRISTLGAILTLVGTSFLLWRSMDSPLRLVSFSIYGFGVLSVFVTSALHHGVDGSPRTNHILRQLDYFAIFLMIAGTYTPFCLLLVKSALGTRVLALVWTLAFAGIASKALYPELPKWATLAMTIGMGWLAVLLVEPMYTALPVQGLVYLLVGGLFFTIGGVGAEK